MKKNHRLTVFENGRVSLEDVSLGETMHSHIGPWEEAQAIYVEQSGLADRLENGTGPLVIFDVGLGLAANALAALHCRNRLVDSGKKVRPLQIVSFENDPGGLKLALEHSAEFPFFAGFEEALRALLEKGSWSSEEAVEWLLRKGDFAHWAQKGFESEPAPELIFYDFYSPKSQPALWTVKNFMALRKVARSDARLVTYSVSTAARVAMVLGGFWVGQGIRTDAKLETTVAACRREDLARPLGAEWIEKLRRSDKILPEGYSEGDRAGVLEDVIRRLGVS